MLMGEAMTEQELQEIEAIMKIEESPKTPVEYAYRGWEGHMLKLLAEVRKLQKEPGQSRAENKELRNALEKMLMWHGNTKRLLVNQIAANALDWKWDELTQQFEPKENT